ncbi:hypothetical protein DFH07DRAFT_943955 [Mycena maculata]|uniref:C2H2-type domain-containing protein n=1 Tax=Mycena maculata TaxID=230809 RepID=A0AAD7ICZ6_9AGAR|nr:hypothetical protein DFH07DRAFT_943955 [Mycena maculata]
MSLSLPIRALAAMQVSLKIGSDGQFALEMGQGSDADIPHAQLDGLKLHLHSVANSTGVILSLFVSVEAESVNRHQAPCNTIVPAESCLDPSRIQSALGCGGGAQSLDFFSQLYSGGTLDSPEASLDFLQAVERDSGSLECPEAFDAFQIYDSLSLEITVEPYDCGMQVMTTELPAFYVNPLQDVAASDSTSPDAKSPDASTSPSESHADYPEPPSSPSGSTNRSSSGSPRPPTLAPRPDLHCPEPSCSRTFTSKYTLSKHAQKHIAKPPPCFPCSMGCSLEFSRRHDRLRHEVSQHGRVREWECKLCMGFFSTQVTLQKHKCKARAKLCRGQITELVDIDENIRKLVTSACGSIVVHVKRSLVLIDGIHRIFPRPSGNAHSRGRATAKLWCQRKCVRDILITGCQRALGEIFSRHTKRSTTSNGWLGVAEAARNGVLSSDLPQTREVTKSQNDGIDAPEKGDQMHVLEMGTSDGYSGIHARPPKRVSVIRWWYSEAFQKFMLCYEDRDVEAMRCGEVMTIRGKPAMVK